jgi:hypothetical protein
MAKTYAVSVRLGGESKPYSEAFQTDAKYANGWRSVLQSARDHGEVSCLCLGAGEKALAVRYYETSDSYGLARYPNTGETHSRDCRFYAPNASKSGLGSYQKGVLEERADETFKIRLGLGLAMKDSPRAKDLAPKRIGNAPRVTQRSMQLLGLLHFLWDAAGLNAWWPALEGKRNLGTVAYRLNEIAEGVMAGRSKLSNVLLTPVQSPSGRDADRNIARVTAALQRKSRLIVIAPLASYKQEPRMLTVQGFHGIPFLDVPSAMWAAATKRFPRAVSAWRNGHQVIVIAQCEPRESSKAAGVVDIALMQVNSCWIPVESSYELVIANKLIAEKRSFVKPMRYDASEDDVHPDFILLDTDAEAPLEVYGREDEAYEIRMEEKRIYYETHFAQGAWWCWNAARDKKGLAIPDFPEKARRSR